MLSNCCANQLVTDSIADATTVAKHICDWCQLYQLNTLDDLAAAELQYRQVEQDDAGKRRLERQQKPAGEKRLQLDVGCLLCFIKSCSQVAGQQHDTSESGLAGHTGEIDRSFTNADHHMVCSLLCLSWCLSSIMNTS